MEINYSKIVEIYGEEYLSLIKDNASNITGNIKYLISIGFTDVIDIFERITPLFIEDCTIFKRKINSLISKIGKDDYVSIIENDLSLLEELE